MPATSQNTDDAIEYPSIKSTSHRSYSKLRIIKNVIVLSIGIHLLFTAYIGLTMLQSTMNREQGVGVISLAVLYICFFISAVLFPKYTIKKLGSKWTFAFSMFTYLPYVASNFYSHWVMMIPSSILIGLGAALLWGSQATYLNDISLMYSDLNMNEGTQTYYSEDSSLRNGLSSDASVKIRSASCDPKSFVIYNDNFQKSISQSCDSIDTKRNSLPNTESLKTLHIETCNISKNIDGGGDQVNEQINNGSLKSSENASTDKKDLNSSKGMEDSNQQAIQDNRRKIIESTTARFFGIHGVAYLSSLVTSNLLTYYILQSEVTENTTSNSTCICGADYCNVESACFEENIAGPSDQMRYILTGICICIGIFAVLVVCLFLDPLEKEKEDVSFSIDLLMATYKLAKKKKLLLLIPFSFYIGMAQAFFTGEFNKSFVGCAWGTYHVGLVAVCYGSLCGVSSFSSGWLVKRLGRIPIFVTATVVNLGASVFLLTWTPSADEPLWFFVGAGLWGVFVGAIWSQLRAFYGVLFKADEEAAFAAFHVWYSLGFALSFGYSNYICTFIKIYILMTFSILGFVGYLTVEIMHLRNKVKK